MAYSFLIFDFGGKEDVAQQARHKVDAWKQGFRLGKKLELKFERNETEAAPDRASDASSHVAKDASKAKGHSKAKPKSGNTVGPAADSKAEPQERIRLVVRLDFSDHEKLSHQRWLDRIPTEDPFKTTNSKIVRAGDPEFNATSELFDSLDRSSRGNTDR